MSEATLPMCFGAVSYYCADSKTCTECPHKARCQVAVNNVIQQMREKLNVDAVMRAYRKGARGKKVSEEKRDETRTQALESARVVVNPVPVQVASPLGQETLSAIKRVSAFGASSELREQLSAGRNPFSRKTPDLFILGELIRKSAASETMMKTAFQQAGLSESKLTAARAALVAMKIVKPSGATLEL